MPPYIKRHAKREYARNGSQRYGDLPEGIHVSPDVGDEDSLKRAQPVNRF